VLRSDAALPHDLPAVSKPPFFAAWGLAFSCPVDSPGVFPPFLDTQSPLVGIATDVEEASLRDLQVTSMPTPIEAARIPEIILAVGSAAILQWMPDGSLGDAMPRSFLEN
jgi:hypothetical protein